MKNKIQESKEQRIYLTREFFSKSMVEFIEWYFNVEQGADITNICNRTKKIAKVGPIYYQFEAIRVNDLSGIEHFKNLKVLILIDQKISNIKPLLKNTKLQELDISMNNLHNNILNIHSHNLPNLKILIARKCGLNSITSLPKNITHLDVAYNYLKKDINGILELDKLKYLNVSYTNSKCEKVLLKNIKTLICHP